MTTLATEKMSRPIGELVELEKPTLTRILLRFRIPGEDAEDLLQEVSLQYLIKRADIREPSRWLSGALRKECLQYWRKRSRCVYDAIDQGLLDIFCDEEFPQQEKQVLVNCLGERIDELEPRCRNVLKLRYRLGYNNEEVAGETGYQKSSIDTIARRCLETLSRRLIGGSLLRRAKHV